MRKALAFSFVALGVAALVAQVSLLREWLAVFGGNEFFIGWTLFAWLSWVALGALAGGRWPGGARPPAAAVAAGHGLAALLFPAALVLVRASRAPGGVAGAIPDPVPAMFQAALALAPLCLVLGAQFVLGARAWREADAPDGLERAVGRAYVLETAGFVAGGILFSFLLATRNSFHVAALAGSLHLLAAGFLCAAVPLRSRRLRGGLLAVAAGLLALWPLAGRFERATSAWRFPGQVLVESRASIYGRLAVTTVGAQVNFHENGAFLGTAEDRQASETLVHFPMLAHPDPRRVLLIGAGFNGALREILKHHPARVDHVELDPLWTDLARRHLAPGLRAALDDPRVRTVFADARAFLRSGSEADSPGPYDVVIVNLPDPATALLNRYYSLEFFRDVRRRLAPGGVLALRLGFSPDQVAPALADLGASIDRTLRAVFASVVFLPEYEILFLASDGPAPTTADLVARHGPRRLCVDFVIPPYVAYRLGTDRVGQVRAAFAARADAPLNRDVRPIACHYVLVHWLDAFHPRLAAFAGRADRVRWPAAAAVVLVWAALAGATARPRAAHRLGAGAMAVASFTLMGGELALLLAFQIFRGYLYRQLALLFAAVMLGMALGAAAGARRSGRARPGALAGLHLLAAATAAGSAAFVERLAAGGLGAAPWTEAVFLLLAVAIGGVAGGEFPVANRIQLAGAADPRRAGIVYAADLAGSCAAALGIGLWALPVLGLGATLGWLAALNVGVALLCLRRRAAA